jgi:hypothetical protein
LVLAVWLSAQQFVVLQTWSESRPLLVAWLIECLLCFFVTPTPMQTFPEEHFSLAAFTTAFSIILSRALYLPAADLFALVSVPVIIPAFYTCGVSLSLMTDVVADNLLD